MKLDIEPKDAEGEPDLKQTNGMMGEYGYQRFSFDTVRKAKDSDLIPRGQNRIRENRPSWIAGGYSKTFGCYVIMVNILVRRNRSSGDLETVCSEPENTLDK